MRSRLIFVVVHVAVRLGVNLNWIFAPMTAWQRHEPLTLGIAISARHQVIENGA